MLKTGVRMQDVFIIDAARSATGKFFGSLSDMPAPHIGANVVNGLLTRTRIDTQTIDEVIVGNVVSAGLGQNPAKQVIVYSGLPNDIPAFNVNKICASGMKAVALGAQSIMCENADVVVAGGIENMSLAPHVVSGVRKFRKLGNANLKEFVDYLNGAGEPLDGTVLKDEMVNAGLWDCYANLHMGQLVEKIVQKDRITREEQDRFALDSHRKAAAAEAAGKFKNEIIPIPLKSGASFAQDEGIRKDSTLEKLSSLKPAFDQGGTVTAGNASQISDGASFMILMSGRRVKELGLKPIAKVEAFAASGTDPSWYGLAPTTAMKKALDRAGHKLGDMDLIEINEAFCAQTLGVVKEMGIDQAKLNVNGGATALGHPIGASGARILTTLVWALLDRKKDLGIASLCHGGGGAAAMVVRRVG